MMEICIVYEKDPCPYCQTKNQKRIVTMLPDAGTIVQCEHCDSHYVTVDAYTAINHDIQDLLPFAINAPTNTITTTY